MEPDELQEDAAFEAAFNDTETEPEAEQAEAPAPAPASDAPAPAPAAEDKPEAKNEEKEEAVEDPFAGLPPKVRDLLAAIPTLQQQLTAEQQRNARLESMVGRVPALQSEVDRLKQGSAAAPQAPAPKPQFEKVAALRAQGLDEIADALEEVVARTATEAPAPQPAAAAPADPAPAHSDPQMEILDELRPAWGDEIRGTDFQLWLAMQPAERQREIASTGKAVVMLKALGEFDAYRARTQSTRQLDASRHARMAAAVVPHGDGRPASRQPAIDDEDAAFEAGFRS